MHRFLHFTVIQLNVEAHCFLITVIMFIHIRGVFRTKSDIQRGVLCGYNKLFTVDVSPASKDISEACSPRVIFIRIGQILVATCKNDAVCRIRLFLSARFIKLNTSNYCRRGSLWHRNSFLSNIRMCGLIAGVDCNLKRVKLL